MGICFYTIFYHLGEKMAKQSKFKDSQINEMLNDMVMVLEKHQAPVDLSLMVLGNMVTHLLTHNMGKQQRQVLAQSFANVLIQSVSLDK